MLECAPMGRPLLRCTAAFVVLSACGTASRDGAQTESETSDNASRGAEVVVTYWRHEHEPATRAMNELIDRFHARNRDVRVVLRTYPYSVFTTKVVAAITAGEGPDIVNIHGSWAYGQIQSGLLQRVPESVLSAREIEQELFPLVRAFERDGAYYALPIGAGNLALFYNKALFRRAGLDPRRPPRTWSELRQMAERLTRRDEHGRLVQAGASIGRAQGSGWNYFVDVVLPQAGAGALAPDERRVAWNTERGVRALRWYTGFIKTHEVNTVLFPDDFDAFRLGLSAMMISGNWDVAGLERVAPDLDLGVAPLPASDDGVRASWATAWGNAVTKNATGRRRDAAWAFVRFLMTEESMKLWWERTGELPVRAHIVEDPAFVARLGPHQAFVAQMPYSQASLKKDEGEYMAAITEAIEQVLLNDMDPREALDRAARRVDRMLARQ